MTTRTFTIALLLIALTAGAALAAVTDTGPSLVLDNGQIKATIAKSSGCITTLEAGAVQWQAPGLGRLLLYPPLPPVYGGETSTPLEQDKGQATVTAAGETVKVVWSTDYGTLTEVLSANGPALVVSYDLVLTQPAWAALFSAEPVLSAAERAQCVFLPDGGPLEEIYRRVPTYEVLHHAPSGRSLGMIALGEDNDRLYMNGARMAVQVRPLHFERQQEYQGVFALYLPQDAAALVPAWRALGVAGEPMPTVQLVKVEAGKLLCDPGEKGTIRATVRNLSPSAQEMVLEVEAFRGLEGSQEAASQTLTLPPFVQQTVNVPWSPGTQEGGVSLQASLRQGRTVVDRVWDACVVKRDWAQVFQLGIMYPSDENAAQSARLLRDSYLSVGHCYSWYEANGSMVPATDKYMSHQDREKSKTGFIKFNQEMHALGLKTNFYWDPFPNSQPGDLELATKDPTIVAYHPNGQPYNGFHGLGTDPYLQWSRDFAIKQFLGSIAMFGWDSMMFDDVTFFQVEDTPFTAYYMRNWKGELAGKELAADADTAGEKWLNEIKAGVRAKYPDFVFMGNCLGPDDFLAGTGMGPKTYAAIEIPLSELGGGGDAVTGQTGVGTWVGLKQVLDAQHQGREGLGLGNKPNYVYIPVPYGGEESTKGTFALFFANRHHLYGWWPAPAGSVWSQPEIQYLRFATRFCEFIYPDNAKWFQPEQVDFLKVNAPQQVAWREYVYERPLPEGRQLLIHLVQQPQGELMWRQSLAPPTRKDVTLDLTLKAGEKVTGAWALSPDMAGERATLKLPTGSPARLVVPELTYYTLLVVNIGK